MIRTRHSADEAGVQRIVDDLESQGFNGSVQFTGEDRHATTGPWSLDALVIDPSQFRRRLRGELTTGIVPGRETTNSIADRTDVVATINGGFYTKEPIPLPGQDWAEPTEISVVSL